MLIHVSFGSARVTNFVLEETMKQYKSVNSGELRNLSTILVELLALDGDSLQSDRIRFVVEGSQEQEVEGLLDLVKNSQTSDSCRAYQCIKTLVNATNRSNVVKEYLLQDPER